MIIHARGVERRTLTTSGGRHKTRKIKSDNDVPDSIATQHGRAPSRPRKRRPRHERDPGFGCRIPAEIVNNWGWFLAFGIALVLLGVLAIVRSVAATVVSMLFFGWLLLFAAASRSSRPSWSANGPACFSIG
jgi:hypothetical protein